MFHKLLSWFFCHVKQKNVIISLLNTSQMIKNVEIDWPQPPPLIEINLSRILYCIQKLMYRVQWTLFTVFSSSITFKWAGMMFTWTLFVDTNLQCNFFPFNFSFIWIEYAYIWGEFLNSMYVWIESALRIKSSSPFRNMKWSECVSDWGRKRGWVILDFPFCKACHFI